MNRRTVMVNIAQAVAVGAGALVTASGVVETQKCETFEGLAVRYPEMKSPYVYDRDPLEPGTSIWLLRDYI